MVKEVADKIDIPLTINGEIWSQADAMKALQESGCSDLMLGRGALSFPDLAKLIKSPNSSVLPWLEILNMVNRYLKNSNPKHPLFVSGRAKQWLGFLQMHYPQAGDLFQKIKRLKQADDIFIAFESEFSTPQSICTWFNTRK